MQKIPAAAENPFPSDMINTYRFGAGQFQVRLHTFGLTGTDVGEFLQHQSTSDFTTLKPGEFKLASFLDPQGRVECYGWCVKQVSGALFLAPEQLQQQTLDRLQRFLISEDVDISDHGPKVWWFALGPGTIGLSGYQGIILEEQARLQEERFDVPVIGQRELDHWRLINGWPSFDGSDYSHELINNLRLFDLSVTPNKGCYPGQETVSKVATRRGAAYSPVLIELNSAIGTGPVYSFEKKIGQAIACVPWNEHFYLVTSLLRDFRVEGLDLAFHINGEEHKGKIRYYPLLPGDPKRKADEVFYQGAEAFKNGNDELAEELFRKAIWLDPVYADAYESLGVMLGRVNRFEEAIALMRQLATIDPGSVLAHTNLSLFLMKLGRIEEAELEKSLATVKSFQKFGDDAKLKEKLDQEKAERLSEWARREDMFRQVLEIDPEDTLANYGLGSIAVEKADWALALPYLEKVLSVDPAYSVAYLALGKALKGVGRRDEARSIWKRGVEVAAKKGDLMPANQMQAELNQL
jgi:tetratricopeptide (TPR) repeat protein